MVHPISLDRFGPQTRRAPNTAYEPAPPRTFRAGSRGMGKKMSSIISIPRVTNSILLSLLLCELVHVSKSSTDMSRNARKENRDFNRGCVLMLGSWKLITSVRFERHCKDA